VRLVWRRPLSPAARDAGDAHDDLAGRGGRAEREDQARGAIHQLLSSILKLRILVLSPVSNLPYVVKVKNYPLIGE
jgi:hypothetical protein